MPTKIFSGSTIKKRHTCTRIIDQFLSRTASASISSVRIDALVSATYVDRKGAFVNVYKKPKSPFEITLHFREIHYNSTVAPSTGSCASQTLVCFWVLHASYYQTTSHLLFIRESPIHAGGQTCM